MKHTVHIKKKSRSYSSWVIVGTSIVIAALVGVAIFNFWYVTPIERGQILADDIARLSAIFKRIDQSAGIIAFQNQKNPINFLTVKKNGFVGSEVGSMSLTYPEKWEGPYLQRNMEFEGIEYQVVRTNKGLFIAPGEGVRLPNKHIIGKDIILDETVDIQALTQEGKPLHFNNQPLAVMIELQADQAPILPEELAQAQQEWCEHNKIQRAA